MPVLLLWGARDAFAPPAWGEELAAGYPNIRFVRVPDAGHLPWIDDPEACRVRGRELPCGLVVDLSSAQWSRVARPTGHDFGSPIIGGPTAERFG